jgi:hypothetical protein
MASEEYAIVILPGGVLPQVWPTRGRAKESFEAYCATCGAAVIRAYPSLEEAVADIYLPIDDRFADRVGVTGFRGILRMGD